MNEDGPEEDIFAGKSSDALLSTLTTRSDYWYNLAKAFPRLYQEGLTAPILAELINVEPARQNIWSVASNVFGTLKRSGELSKDELIYFNNEETGPDCLMELRFLDVERRIEGARYIAQQALGPSDSVVLARAIKEQQRRSEGNPGFTAAAGDCLAFKFFRDAQETRKPEEAKQFLKRGLGVAVTDSARARLADELKQHEAPAEDEAPPIELSIVRLAKDELGFCVVPIAGKYGVSSAADVQRTQRVDTEGTFSTFSLQSTASRCAVLPKWSVLAMARRPAALSLSDASTVPEICEATGAKNDKDVAKLRTPGLMIVDAEVGSVQADAYYLQERDGAAVLVRGDQATDAVAKLLFVSLPPRGDMLPDSFDV